MHLKTWTCKRSWESAAIAAVANHEGCQFVAGEIYDCPDRDEVIRRGDDLFALLGGV